MKEKQILVWRSLSLYLLRYYVRENQSLRVVLSYVFLNKTIFFEQGCTNSLAGHQIILKSMDSLHITHTPFHLRIIYNLNRSSLAKSKNKNSNHFTLSQVLRYVIWNNWTQLWARLSLQASHILTHRNGQWGKTEGLVSLHLPLNIQLDNCR